MDSFMEAVDRADECYLKTDIIYGLDSGLSDIFQFENGMRADTEKVAILITDGQDSLDFYINNTVEDYVNMKQRYIERGIKLLVIGVGDIDESRLVRLLQSPEDLFHEETFDEFTDRIIEEIGAKICEGTHFYRLKVTS